MKKVNKTIQFLFHWQTDRKGKIVRNLVLQSQNTSAVSLGKLLLNMSAYQSKHCFNKIPLIKFMMCFSVAELRTLWNVKTQFNITKENLATFQSYPFKDSLLDWTAIKEIANLNIKYKQKRGLIKSTGKKSFKIMCQVFFQKKYWRLKNKTVIHNRYVETSSIPLENQIVSSHRNPSSTQSMQQSVSGGWDLSAVLGVQKYRERWECNMLSAWQFCTSIHFPILKISFSAVIHIPSA